MSEKSVGDHEAFVALIRTAREDPDVRKKLQVILDQPPFHRRSLLNTLVAELRVQSAPAGFIRAVACLPDDEVARKARELLSEK